jgi:hypothetical protein
MTPASNVTIRQWRPFRLAGCATGVSAQLVHEEHQECRLVAVAASGNQ